MGRLLPLRRPKRTGTIHLCDDSLSDAGILANFLAIVELFTMPENGDLAAVIVAGQLLVRFFWRTEEACIHLAPANPAYPVKCVESDQIVVVGRIRETFAVKAISYLP